MDSHTKNFKVRLGLFVTGGLVLFVMGVFIIGKQKNLFNPVFKLSTTFYNVSGLQIGNKVRFSGTNVGTVDNIFIINDSTVKVDMLIKKSVKQFIRSDCQVAIGSEGIIGDRLLIISHGSPGAPLIKEGQRLSSIEPTETDAIMASLKVTVDNVATISAQLSEIVVNINSGNGILGRLIQDSSMAENFDMTMVNLKNSSKGLNENLEAIKHNILLKGYFKRKTKASEKIKDTDVKNVNKSKSKN